MKQTQAIYAPTCRLEGLDRLDLLDWDEVHDSVQSVLQTLDEPLTRLCAGCRAASGRNSGGSWELFSYRTYYSARSEIDPIVVGVTFSHSDRGTICMQGDISGETSGDVLIGLPLKEVIGKLAVLEKVRDLGEILAHQAPKIAAALNDPRRRI